MPVLAMLLQLRVWAWCPCEEPQTPLEFSNPTGVEWLVTSGWVARSDTQKGVLLPGRKAPHDLTTKARD